MFDFLRSPGPSVYESSNYLVLDFETDTSHGDFGHPVHDDNALLLACWKTAGGPMVSRWGDEYSAGVAELLAAIEAADFVVAHNAKYELGWLIRAGLDPHTVLVFDTKIAEYVLLGNLAAGDAKKGLKGRSTSLDQCVRRRGGPIKDPVTDLLLEHGHNPVTFPRPWLQGRCEQDVRTTEELFLSQRTALRNTGRLPLVYTRCVLTPVLASIELEGIALDPQRVADEIAAHRARYQELLQEMDAMTGGINWRSAKQAGEFIYDKLGFAELLNRRGEPDRTAGGGRKTDADTLAALVAKTPEQRRFKELRAEIGKVNAALTKNLEYFEGVCKEKGGVMHALFNQTTTATHRLSSSGIPTAFECFGGDQKSVQFQNLPRAFKPLVQAKREGWYIGEWDGSQLEFRTAVELSQDVQGMKDVESKWDVHKFTASVLLRKAIEKVTKEERQDAKADTFKPVYGGERGTPEQEAYYAAFRERYPQLAETQERWVHQVLADKDNCLRLPWGMRFYWPHARMDRRGKCNVKSSIYNYPVQSFATAEIIPIALVYFWHLLRERGLEGRIILINTVHDSVICEVHPDFVEEFKELARDVWHYVYRYLRDVYQYVMSVPLGTEVTVGTHWSDKEAVATKYDIYPEWRQAA